MVIFSSFGNPATINAIPARILIGRGPNISNILEVMSYDKISSALLIGNVEDVAIRVFKPCYLHIAGNVNIAFSRYALHVILIMLE